jgi:hypothetical protein
MILPLFIGENEIPMIDRAAGILDLACPAQA